jgi:Deoxyribonuclease NucA/NucB
MRIRTAGSLGSSIFALIMLSSVGPVHAIPSSSAPFELAPSACTKAASSVEKRSCAQPPARTTRLADPATQTAAGLQHNVLEQQRPQGVRPNDFSECSAGGSNPDRFVSCAWEPWTLNQWEEIDGEEVLVGELPITFKSVVQFDENGLTGAGPTWSLSVEIDTGVGTGPLDIPMPATLETGCEKAADVCATDGSAVMPIEIAPESSQTFEWRQRDIGPASQASGLVDTLTGHLGAELTVDAPANPVDFDDASLNTLWGRCDSVNPNVACVDDKAAVAVSFNGATNNTIKEVAEHVFNAEASLPSHWGNPHFYPGSALHRTLDGTIEAANRAVACVNVPPSCDEYPMASTLEGASRSAPGDWSAITVPKAANDAQGGTMTTFYGYDRVIDQDPYYVLAVKQDGTRSW